MKPQSCIDIVIRHVAPIPGHYDIQDRFRIELSEEGAEGRVVGRKDITSVLRAPAYPLELQGHSEPAPNPGPPSWTGPTPARQLQESELSRFSVCMRMPRHVSTCALVFTLVEARGWFSSISPHLYFFETGSHTDPNIHSFG